MASRIEVTSVDGKKHFLELSDIGPLTKPTKSERAAGTRTILERKNGELLAIREGYRWIKARLCEKEAK